MGAGWGVRESGGHAARQEERGKKGARRGRGGGEGGRGEAHRQGAGLLRRAPGAARWPRWPSCPRPAASPGFGAPPGCFGAATAGFGAAAVAAPSGRRRGRMARRRRAHRAAPRAADSPRVQRGLGGWATRRRAACRAAWAGSAGWRHGWLPKGTSGSNGPQRRTSGRRSRAAAEPRRSGGATRSASRARALPH